MKLARFDDFDPDSRRRRIEQLVDSAIECAVESCVETGVACAHIDEMVARIRGAP
jgi:hypothetical protein